MNKRDQSPFRLLVFAVLLLVAAARQGLPPVSAAPSTAIEGNPYFDPTQCVYRAWELAVQAGYTLPYFGNAAEWRQGAIDAGYDVVDSIDPSVAVSVAVWGSGVGGASYYGHVGWVVAVEGDQFLVQDRNWIPASDDERWVTWQPGIAFIRLGSPAAAEASPTPAAPTPTAAATAVPTPTPTDAPAASASLLERRVAASPADRSPRSADTAPIAADSSAQPAYSAAVTLPGSWSLITAGSWGDVLHLLTPGPTPVPATGQPGPRRTGAGSVQVLPGLGLSPTVPRELSSFSAPSPWPKPSPTPTAPGELSSFNAPSLWPRP